MLPSGQSARRIYDPRSPARHPAWNEALQCAFPSFVWISNISVPGDIRYTGLDHKPGSSRRKCQKIAVPEQQAMHTPAGFKSWLFPFLFTSLWTNMFLSPPEGDVWPQKHHFNTSSSSTQHPTSVIICSHGAAPRHL